MVCPGTAVWLHAVTAFVSGDRYLSNDVNHLVGPALIGEEIDDSGGHVPSHCCLLGTMSSVSVMDTRFQVCVQELRSIAIRR